MCPGSTDSTVLDSGAPKNTEGMVSRKVCVIDIEMIKIDIINGEVNNSNEGEELKINNATKFMCIPGMRPVNIPAKIPILIAIIISINI